MSGGLSQEYDDIGAIVVDSALKVHRKLGPGLLEKLYETCLTHELRLAGLQVARQVRVPIIYDGILMEEHLRIDLLLEGKVIVEVKAAEALNPVWHAQVLSQLKITGHRLGFLINFDVPLIKQGIKRIVL